MAEDVDRRQVVVERVGAGQFAVTNARGGRVAVGTGDGADFSPTELLLAAIGCCTGIDVDTVTSRRAEPETFQVDVAATKVCDTEGNRLTDIAVTFQVSFPAGPSGDEARAALPKIVTMSHDRLCTVSRTIELGTPVSTTLA